MYKTRLVNFLKVCSVQMYKSLFFWQDAQRMQEHMKKKKVEVVKYMEEKGITLQDYYKVL